MLNTSSKERPGSIEFAREGNLAKFRFPNAALTIAYGYHDTPYDPNILPENLNAIFVEGPSNWPTVANSYPDLLRDSEYGPLLKKAMGQNIPVIDCDPHLKDEVLDSDGNRVYANFGLAAGSAAAVLVTAHLAHSAKDVDRRTFFKRAAGILALSTAYFGAPVAEVATAYQAQQNGSGHDLAAKVYDVTHSIRPETLEHKITFRNLVMAYKQLWYFDQLGTPGRQKPSYLSLLGGMHLPIERQLKSSLTNIESELAGFSTAIPRIIQTPKTFYSMRINHSNGKSEVIVVPQLKQLFDRFDNRRVKRAENR